MERCWTPSDPRPHPDSAVPGRYAEMMCPHCGYVFTYGWHDILQARPFVIYCLGCRVWGAMPVWGRRTN